MKNNLYENIPILNFKEILKIKLNFQFIIWFTKKEKFYFEKHPRTRLSIYFDVKYFLGNSK